MNGPCECFTGVACAQGLCANVDVKSCVECPYNEGCKKCAYEQDGVCMCDGKKV